MKQTCKVCGAKAESEFCFRHKPRKRMSCRIQTKEDRAEIDQMRNFFIFSIWRVRPHVSEVSGEPLLGEARSVYFHHILPKEKFPQAKFDPDNIILLTLDEHTNVESNMYKYDEINRRRELLKTKYDLL